MYLRICENIAEISTILVILMAYTLCLQQFAFIDTLPLQRVTLVESATEVNADRGHDRLVSASGPAPASKTRTRRIIYM